MFAGPLGHDRADCHFFEAVFKLTDGVLEQVLMCYLCGILSQYRPQVPAVLSPKIAPVSEMKPVGGYRGRSQRERANAAECGMSVVWVVH